MSPMYMAGRLRTASRPSNTWILDALYSDKTKVFEACKRFEAGIEAVVKVVFDRMSVGVDFNRAFTKALKEGDAKVYSQVIGLTFGYKF